MVRQNNFHLLVSLIGHIDKQQFSLEVKVFDFHALLADMSTLLESKEALRSRGLEVSLTVEEIEALITNRVDSLARLAFAAWPPGGSPNQ